MGDIKTDGENMDTVKLLNQWINGAELTEEQIAQVTGNANALIIKIWQLKNRLHDIAEIAEEYADAEYHPGSASPAPNDWMRVLVLAKQ